MSLNTWMICGLALCFICSIRWFLRSKKIKGLRILLRAGESMGPIPLDLLLQHPSSAATFMGYVAVMLGSLPACGFFLLFLWHQPWDLFCQLRAYVILIQSLNLYQWPTGWQNAMIAMCYVVCVPQYLSFKFFTLPVNLSRQQFVAWYDSRS